MSMERAHVSSHTEFPAEPRLWDMLIRRSPDLEELHINGAPFISTQIVHPLCYAHWPKLHTLSLGDILLDWNPRPGVKPPFVAFLEAHPQLRSLRISRAALNPAHLTSLEPGSLPELTRFSGAVEHLQALAPIHHQISSVALDEPFVIRDVAPSLLASVLRGLKSLSELRVCFVFQTAYEGGSLVRSIAHACPGLTKLEIVCTRKSSLTVVRWRHPFVSCRHSPVSPGHARQSSPLPSTFATSSSDSRSFSARKSPHCMRCYNRTHAPAIARLLDNIYSARHPASFRLGNRSNHW